MSAEQRGVTLIELMITVSVLAIATNAILHGFTQYERATSRAIRMEGVARVLDQEMEHIRSCRSRACVRALVGEGQIEESKSWVRVKLTRRVQPGPDGTLQVTLTAIAPRLRPQTLSALVRVSR